MDQLQIERLTKALKTSSASMGVDEARYLVDAYYSVQQFRIDLAGKMRANSQGVDQAPAAILGWFLDQSEQLEGRVKLSLKHYADNHHMGKWAQGVVGIGPVLSAGLLAHIDIEKAPTAGHIWAFAGLDPTKKWEKKTKRPWNAALKVLCFKIGESFVKTCNHKDGFYGRIYADRKALEQQRNEAKQFADQAASALEAKKYGKATEAYKAYSVGMLPPAHIHARARRYAVKLFLSHWHGEAYRHHFGKEPPLPYPIAMLGHAHMIEAVS